MSNPTDPLHQLILLQFGARRRLALSHLVDTFVPRVASSEVRAEWRTELELRCELLALRGYLVREAGATETTFVATPRVRPIAARRPPRSPSARARTPSFLRRMTPAVALGTAATAALAVSACASLDDDGESDAPRGPQSYWGNEAPPPKPVIPPARLGAPVQRPGDEPAAVIPTRAPVVSTTEQVRNRDGNAVYRMCYDNCPAPTPKQPKVVKAATGDAIPANIAKGPVVDLNAKAQRSLADMLAAQFQGKTPGAAAPQAVEGVDAPAPRAPVRHRKVHRKHVAKAPAAEVKEGTAPENAATDAAKDAAKDTGKEGTPAPVAATKPAADNPGAFITQMAPDTRAPIAVPPVRRKYVDRKGDPNADASPEERARIDRLMGEARDAHRPTAAPAAPVAPATPVATPGAGRVDDPGMRTLDVAASTAGTDIEAFLTAWAAAWTQRDATTYAQLYAAGFVGYNAASGTEFLARRSLVMAHAKDLSVQVQPIHVALVGDTATVRFWQDYRSARFKSRIQKVFELVREDGAWKIRRERVVTARMTPDAGAKGNG